MGQHVYIEPGAEGDEDSDELRLPAYYLLREEGKAFVYAADGDGRIEKRPVLLGKEDEETGTVVILEGLSYLDRIAFPDETVQVGMAVSETSYMPEDMMGSDDEMGFMDGMEGMDGMPGMPMDEYASDMDAPEEPVGGPDA